MQLCFNLSSSGWLLCAGLICFALPFWQKHDCVAIWVHGKLVISSQEIQVFKFNTHPVSELDYVYACVTGNYLTAVVKKSMLGAKESVILEIIPDNIQKQI